MLRPSALALLAILTGCAIAVPIRSPREYVENNQPSTIWVTRDNGATVRVDKPTVLGDTLTGLVGGEPMKIPFSDITSATIQRGSADKVVKVSVGVGVAIAAGVLVYKVTHQAKFPAQQ